MLREASNQVCFRGTVAAKALDRTFKKRTASKVEISPLSNIPNAAAKTYWPARIR
jgi:hypothetical protein